MKYIYIILLFFTGIINAQWQTQSSKDEFGDYTGKTTDIMVFKGKFSNSATINSNAMIRFVKYNNAVSVGVLEYNSSWASFCADWVRIMVKKADGSKYQQVYTTGVPTAYGTVGSDYKYCADSLTYYDPKPGRRKRLTKQGKYFMVDKLRDLTFGDKVYIVTSNGTNYLFELSFSNHHKL